MPYGLTLADWMAGPGTTYYWDPVGGNDSNSGLTIALARLTFTSVYGLLTSGQGDHVVWVDPSGTAQHNVTGESVNMTKEATALFGPGPMMAKLGQSTNNNTLIIGTEECLVSGFDIDGAKASTGVGVFIESDANGSVLHNCRVTAQTDAIQLQAPDARIIGCHVNAPGDEGIRVAGTALRSRVIDTVIQESSNAINVLSSADDFIVDGCYIFDNTVGVTSAANRTIAKDTAFVGNGTDVSSVTVFGGLLTDGSGKLADNTVTATALAAGAITDAAFPARTELAAVPAANASLDDMIGWMFLYFRNKMTQTSTTWLVKADDTTTTVGTSTVSDDGTTFTRGEFS